MRHERKGAVVARVEGEIVINRPVEEVFDFVADERNEPQYNARMLRARKVSPGSIGAGTRFEAEMKGMRRPVAMTVEFTAFERPRRLDSSAHLSTMEIHGALDFDPVEEGTRMRWAWNLEPRGPYKLMAPLIRSIGRRQEQAIWTSLKRLLERSGASPRSGA
jgi:Polyketide cyclase / dehydrase and lipid transport